MALQQIELVAGAVVKLDGPVFGEGGAGLVPHFCVGGEQNLVTGLAKTITEFSILGIENEVFLEEADFFEHLGAEQVAAAGDEIAFAHLAIARVVLAFPTDMTGVAMERAYVAAGMPKDSGAV